MKTFKILSLLLLLCSTAFATAVRGTLINVSGTPLPGGSITLTLSSTNLSGVTVPGCGDGTTPNVRNSGTITTMSVKFTAGAGGALFGTVVGNDQIDCGSGFGVGTYYVVVATDATGAVAWTKNYKITGGTWTPASTALTVVPPSVLPVAIVQNPSGNQTVTQPGGTSLTISGTFIASLTGNATTATALAANGSNCAAGSFPAGVDAAGNAEACTPLPTSIAGTANQVIASASTGTITLSLPQSIATTSSPTFAALTITGTSSVSALSATTSVSGASFIGTATANNVDILTLRRFTDTAPTGNFQRYRNAANTTDLWMIDITGSLAAGTVPAARVSGVLTAANLPTPTATTLGGIESFAAVTHQWINAISTAGVPTATQPAFTDISGTTTIAQGGTGQTTYALGDLLVGTAGSLTRLAIGANGSCLVATAGTAAWGSCSVASSSYATIQNAGTAVTQRTIFNAFNGLQAVDNVGATRTDISPVYGTAANTVAQGNDSRITGAAQLTASNNFTVSQEISGNTGLPAATTGQLWIASGFTTPTIGRLYVGDGTGWRLEFVKRTASTDTVEAWINDGGILNVITGFQVGGGGTSGTVLRGNGTNYVPATLAAADLSNGVSGTGAVALVASPTFSGTVTAATLTATALQLGGTDISSATQTLTNKTLDAEGTGNNITVPIKLWYQAASCNNASPTPIWDTSTATVPSAVCVTGTNVVKGTLRYAVNTQQFAQFHFKLPADLKTSTTWDVNLYWTTATASGTATFALDYACTGTGATDDPAFTAWQSFASTAGTANVINIQSVTGQTTTCTAGQFIHFRVKRTDTAGTATNADVVGVELTYRRTE